MRPAGSIASTLIVLCLLACTPADPPPARNLLLITLDTLRADHLGVYGYPRPTSPALDRFAAGATVFTDATCSIPTTLPSHVSIFTGLRPTQHGVRRNGAAPDRDLVSIFDLLAANGTRTAAVIASQVVGERYLSGLGIDEVIYPGPKRRYQAGAKRVTEHATAWLDAHAEEPFALWLHYYDTHEPYEPPAEVLRHFDRGYDGELPDALATKRLVGFNKLAPGTLSSADLAHVTDLYDAEIAALDRQLGLLFEALEARGLLANSLVVLVGDHGQALGESGFFGHGLRLLEPVVKVPMIVRLPGEREGTRADSPVETIDLLPTVAELMNLEPPTDLPGRSLVPALSGARLGAGSPRVVERRLYDDRPDIVGAAIHAGAWKAVFYRDEDGSETRFLGRRDSGLDGENLFTADSDEARWLEAVVAGLTSGDGPVEAEMDEEQRRMLEALGYLD